MPNEQYKQFDCYRILGISHSASPQEIRAAYKQASLRSHPDRGGSHDAMVRVNLAFQVLSNPIERQAHDIYWKSFSARSNTTSPPRTNNFHQSTNTRKKEHQQQKQPKYRETPKREPLVGLKNRIYHQIEQEKARIWQDLNNRAKRYEATFKQNLSNKKQEAFFTFIGAIGLAAITITFQFTILWIGVAVLGFSLLSKLGGVQIGNRSFSIFDRHGSTRQGESTTSPHL